MSSNVNASKAPVVIQNNEELETKIDKYWRTSRNGKSVFDHVELGKELYEKNALIWHNEELYYYKKGVYVPGGKRRLEGQIQRILGKESNKQRKAEVIDWIETTVREKEIKVNPDLEIINLKNGLYNLRNGEFVEHSPLYYSTIQIPVSYNPEAKCPKIMEFFKSVVTEESIPFVLEWFGYSLLRDYKISKALMLHGTGGNGKSIFIQVYNAFLGNKNVSAVDLHSLETNRFAPSRLIGKLANSFADIDSAYLETSRMIKSLTGNDDVIAEFKGRDVFEFKSFAKLVFSANKLPSFKDNSEGLFDRWIILPFPNRFRGSKNQNLNLLDSILTGEELSGLLNYAIEALTLLLDRGYFTISEPMQAEIDKWKNQTDNVKIFIDEHCIIDDTKATEKKALYNRYKSWCIDSEYKPLKLTNFYDRMTVHGYEPKQGNSKSLGRKHYFFGIEVPDRYY